MPTVIDGITGVNRVTDGSIVATDFAPGAVAGGFSTPINFRNKIINGAFDIWQRATSQTTDGYGSADRWSMSHLGSTKVSSRQTFALGQTDVPNQPTYFSRTVVTSIAGAGNFVAQIQNIESVRTLAGSAGVLTLWAKADAAKNIAVEFVQVFGTGGSPSASVTGISVTTLALTTSWQKFTVPVTFPSIAGKTLGTAGDDRAGVFIWFDAGSNFNARTNSLGQQSGTFDIAQVQLEEGTVATPFEARPPGVELALCQRYYELSSLIVATGVPASAVNLAGSTAFSVRKRVNGTVTRLTDNYTWGQIRCPGATTYGTDLFHVRGYRTTDGTQGQAQWSELVAVDAEL